MDGRTFNIECQLNERLVTDSKWRNPPEVTDFTYKTAESVCEGHPDKLCDKIADAILDAYLRKDKSAHVAVEVIAVGRRIIVGGEISSTAKVNIQAVVWRVLDDIGMKSWRHLLQVYVRKQSPDIAGGVNYCLSETVVSEQNPLVLCSYLCPDT